MTKQADKTINAFSKRRPFGKHLQSVWTDGNAVYSYELPIMAFDEDDHVFIINHDESPSKTTTKQINSCLREYHDAKRCDYLTMKDLVRQ